MNQKIITLIAQNLNLPESGIKSTVQLLLDGNTIPFIARYRKDQTGDMLDTDIEKISLQWQKYETLIKRKDTILISIAKQGKLTDELRAKINEIYELEILEDLYLPFKPKRETKGEKAKKLGLEPLAKKIKAQQTQDLTALVAPFICEKVPTSADALTGARDIISEWVNESSPAREAIRKLFARHARIYAKVIKGREKDGQKYQDYFDYDENLARIASHRLLAIRRGEDEKILRVRIEPPEEYALERLERGFVHGKGDVSTQMQFAVKEAYRRLMKPSIETEFKNNSKAVADETAITVFAKNTEKLLLDSPLGPKNILAIDPGIRTGCKMACLTQTGDLRETETFMLNYRDPLATSDSVKKLLQRLVTKNHIDAIAIGNGTASRETETFIRSLDFERSVEIFIVSESGASIYSASEVAREEFPDLDVVYRGAASIGRRLLDPLSELVKIDPKSIGVGQYQHSVDQKMLKNSLDHTVERCVNRVGVNVNTASKYLLKYIAGVGETLAQNVIEYRREHGQIGSRAELKKVKKMGAQTFEQCAGFLRIKEGKQPLDNSAVHPDHYGIVKQMAKDLKVSIQDLVGNKDLIEQVELDQYVTDDVGRLTLKDILAELQKPGHDPRPRKAVFAFAEDIKKFGDLKPGLELPGIVTNVTDFGAFIDIGIKENALLHVSKITEPLSVQETITVVIEKIDPERKRIGVVLLGG
jgi:uncharacterized protein